MPSNRRAKKRVRAGAAPPEPSEDWHKSHTDTRAFVPENIFGKDVDLRSHLHDCDCAPFVFLPCHKDLALRHPDDIVVAVDGACRDNGYPEAKSAYGIYFAVDSPHNVGSIITDSTHSSQRAELRACLEAVGKVRDMEDVLESTGEPVDGLDGHLRHLIIKADSAYLVRGITEYIEKWRTNGYKTARGTPVVNADLFQRLDREVETMKDMGVHVRFWQVPRAYNQEADKLANAALDGMID
ncbi:MAG: hypothetical protein Q9181_003206 [Wetmoreana brouardii]